MSRSRLLTSRISGKVPWLLKPLLYHVLARGYVDHFLAEVARTQEGHYTDQQLIVTLIDFFTGETLSSFNFAISYLQEEVEPCQKLLHLLFSTA